MDRELFDYLLSFVSDYKKARFEEILGFRTNYLTVVLENVQKPHNASAVLRSCDCFGLQHLHIVESMHRYRFNPDIEKGASQWVDIHRHDSTRECLQHLKSQGYKIVATSPHETGKTPDTLDLSQKTAVVFGTEDRGISKDALAMADETLRIPMFGFTESLNMSVCVAVSVQRLISRLHQLDIGWHLDEKEKQHLREKWTRHCVYRADLLEKRFLADRSKFREE